jgi:aryl-alcohol dehydrogenase-like predicted oxidoreductase
MQPPRRLERVTNRQDAKSAKVKSPRKQIKFKFKLDWFFAWRDFTLALLASWRFVTLSERLGGCISPGIQRLSSVMQYRTLGKSGIQVSQIGVGAWQLGGPLILDGKMDGHADVGKQAAIDLIHRCGDELGINFIDTAEQYGAGESERRVGEALAGRRDKWIISTKFGMQVGDVQIQSDGTPSGKRVNDVSAGQVPKSLEASLRRLRTDYIDVYLYHSPPNPAEGEKVAHFLEAAKRKGQIRAVGISTVKIEGAEYLHGIGCLDVIQFPENMIDRQPTFRALMEKHHIGGILRGAFAGGRLSGKYFHAPPVFSPQDIRGTRLKPEEFRKYAALEKLVLPNRTMPQTALRWLLDQPTTNTIILGAKTFGEYRDAAMATELASLSSGEMAEIDVIRQTIMN